MPLMVRTRWAIPNAYEVRGSQLHAAIEIWLGAPTTGSWWRLAGFRAIARDTLDVLLAFPAEEPLDWENGTGKVWELRSKLECLQSTNGTPHFRVGSQSGRIMKPSGTMGNESSLELVSGVSWGELVNLPGMTAWGWDFVSPTTFSAGRRYDPFFTPERVLNNVHSRLKRAIAGHDPDPQFLVGDFFSKHVSIATETVDIHIREIPAKAGWDPRKAHHNSRHKLLAFQGTARHRLTARYPSTQGPDAFASGTAQQELARVLAFARYSGVGARTAYGMGQVKIEPILHA